MRLYSQSPLLVDKVFSEHLDARGHQGIPQQQLPRIDPPPPHNQKILFCSATTSPSSTKVSKPSENLNCCLPLPISLQQAKQCPTKPSTILARAPTAKALAAGKSACLLRLVFSYFSLVDFFLCLVQLIPRSSLKCSRVTGDKKKAGVIRKYGLNMSRQAFREQAEAIGFKKVSFVCVHAGFR